jgi:ABC-type Na+ efflux pump permease subunit
LIGSYFVFAVAFSALAIGDSLRSRSVSNPYLSAYVVAFQVAIGLPLVLTTAAMAVVEERARGSFDVLLATTLPTRHIVLAKW